MSDGGKGSNQGPTDHKKFSSNYENIKWTTEEDEEFDRIERNQNGSSAKRPVARYDSSDQTPTR